MALVKTVKRDIEHARIKTDFETQLGIIKPQLFHMADQILDEPSPQERWGAMWVDDKGGRLPALFARSVLKQSGVNLPTYFVMAGRRSRHRFSSDMQPQFERLKPHSEEAKRGLIVTDTVAAGGAIGFLAWQMSRWFEAVDVATVASHTELPKNKFVGSFYTGGRGAIPIHRANATFESVHFTKNVEGATTRGHLKNIVVPRRRWPLRDHEHTYPLDGMDARPAEGSIHGRRHEDKSFTDVAAFARKCIRRAADEYIEQR